MIVYAPAAEGDVVRLHDNLEQHSVVAAAKFMESLASAEQRIAARPETYRRLRDGQTRRFSLRINRTTFLIDYQVEPDQIVILRVWHGRQERPE